jgi:hypothetical protein
MSYEQLEQRLAAWAAGQPAVRAVLAIGSRGRGDPDRWSDLDVLILTTGRAPYVDDPGWLTALGDPWLKYLEKTDGDDWEWFVLLDAEGLKFDAVLMEVPDEAADLATLLKPYAHWDAIQRGVKVLFDRTGAPRFLPPTPVIPNPLPSEAEFTKVVSAFLLESVIIARFIDRGDLWRAQYWFEYDMRHRLLRVVEWQAQGQGRDVWFIGRFMEQWADERALAALPKSFALMNRESMEQAMRAMFDLMRLMGTDAAARFGFAYPAAEHDRARALIESIFAGASKQP